MTPKIRTLIVDDEPLARKKLSLLLKREPDIEFVGESVNGKQAIKTIRETSPELIFLDIQMPGLDGFGTLEALGAIQIPALIFVTAHDKHALRALEVQALDYVLKPFDRHRLQIALERARAQILMSRSGQTNQDLLSLFEDLRSTTRVQKRIVVRNGGNLIFLPTEEIDWIEAAANYVRLHMGGHSYLLRETLTNMETKLDQRLFARIHRSTIVNVERIKKLQPLFHGDYEVLLQNGVRLTLSRNYRNQLERALSHSF